MLDLTSFDAALKEYYTADKVEDLTYQNRPFLALVPKSEDFYGDVHPVPVYYGNPQGRSASFARAKARGANSSSKLKKFMLTRVSDYGYVTIDNETMLASQNDKGAFMRARTTEINGIINSLAQSVATALAGTGYGEIGQIQTGSSVSGTTITLQDPDSVVNFEVDMELVVAAAYNTGATRALGSSGNGLIITAIDRDAGTLTFAYNVNDSTNGIPAIAADDYLFVRGDRDEGSSPSMVKLAGVQAWCPASAPGSTAFFGVDRTADVVRLGGIRKDLSGYPIEEALIEGANYAFREGASIDHYIMHTSKFSDLVKALGSKVQYVDVKASASIGFRAVEVHGPNGTVRVLGDRTWNKNIISGLTLNTWELKSLGKLFQAVPGDGLEVLRLSDSDGVEARFGYYANLKNKAPGQNITITHS